MGLLLNLPKEMNRNYEDYPSAYWAIDELSYDTTTTYFSLKAYPNRNAKHAHMMPIPEGMTFGIGAPAAIMYDTTLYCWNCALPTADIFLKGIPLDSDEQKRIVYEWIKSYTDLPFEDVFE